MGTQNQEKALLVALQMHLWTPHTPYISHSSPHHTPCSNTHVTTQLAVCSFQDYFFFLLTCLNQHRTAAYPFLSGQIPVESAESLATYCTSVSPTWLVYIASKALLNSIAWSCFLESLCSTPSALVSFTFFFESKTFWSWRNHTSWEDFTTFLEEEKASGSEI